MSEISDEKLVIDAVKGDCQAMELLKERVKSYIRLALEQGERYRDAQIKVLESQIVEKVLNSLHAYRFLQPVQVWVGRIALNMAQLRHPFPSSLPLVWRPPT